MTNELIINGIFNAFLALGTGVSIYFLTGLVRGNY